MNSTKNTKPRNVTFILGAGFSAALESGMPMMAKLSEMINEKLKMEGKPPVPNIDNFKSDFEALMTYLASQIPWLDEGDNLRNRASFYDVASTVAQVIRECQNEAFKQPMPDWLAQLIHYWDFTSSKVITFNYDEVVERAAAHSIRPWTQNASKISLHPVALTPAKYRHSQGLMWSDSADHPFTLLKLHGSVNWYYSGWDAPHGDTIYTDSDRPNWTPPIFPISVDRNVREVSDKVPMIVPPVATKNDYYGHDVLRAQWRMAAEALRDSFEICVIGYSAPETDLLVRGLIGSNFKGGRISWVNPCREPAERITKFSPPGFHPEVNFYDSIKSYTQEAITSLILCNECSSVKNRKFPSFVDAYKIESDSRSCPICENSSLLPPQTSGEESLSCECCKSFWKAEQWADDYYYWKPGSNSDSFHLPSF
ncbi:hypothetical protein [Nocardiopsis valliformis]|uniref:hypothetical protein n=1 Tax=Nocardiopsis valliformis TaxID=239974 RepID=UPI00126811BC|nr:hypothetical protein [Nocardiopsis valliformis]